MESPFFTMNRSDWPGPNGYRDATGAPGPNTGSSAQTTHRRDARHGREVLSGTVTVHYTNNSPDTLRFVWMQLDQNLFRASSEGSYLFPGGGRNSGAGFDGGYVLGGVTVDGRAVTPFVDGTMMRLDLPDPLPARGGRITIVAPYHFRGARARRRPHGARRAALRMAQWYPRMVVYDDVRGWNIDQYLGQGEFYLEYGDIDYRVTVPAGYTVGGAACCRTPTKC